MKLLLSRLSISMPPLKRFIQELVTRIKARLILDKKWSSLVGACIDVHACTKQFVVCLLSVGLKTTVNVSKRTF